MIGLRDGEVAGMIDLEVFHPSECADRLIAGKTDIGLIPVAMIASMKEYHIVSDYCLSTNGEVRTVLLVSNSPFDKIRRIYLDFRSRSSVTLCRILAAKAWHRDFEWLPAPREFDITTMKDGEAAVMIGDRCFEYAHLFPFRLDLGLEWKTFTGLPFVFACWAANRKIDRSFLEDFNNALGYGVNNIDAVVREFGRSGTIKGDDLRRYLTENIEFILDDQKDKAMNLFLELLSTI